MLREDPGDPFLRYALAMEFVSEGDDAKALEHFTLLVREHPEYVPGYMQMGLALTRLGRTEEARQCLERGIVAARTAGEEHAAEEMRGLLATLDA